MNKLLSNHTIRKQQIYRFIILIIGTKINKILLDRLKQIFVELNVEVDAIQNLEKRQSKFQSITISTRQRLIKLQIKKAVLQIFPKQQISFSIQDFESYQKKKKLALFDSDMTLIQCEVIDELAKLAGKGEHVEKITQAAMEGKLDFKLSLIERVKCLEGLSLAQMQALKENLPLTQGAKSLIQSLKCNGCKISVVSGGFQFFIDHMVKILGLNYGYANELEMKDDILTGKLRGRIIDPNTKASIFEDLRSKNKIDSGQTIAIGDGVNDLPMLKKTNLGIAFNAKEKVQNQALSVFNERDMSSIFCFLS